MEWTLEVVVLPISDINRSIEFYRDQVGFWTSPFRWTRGVELLMLTI